MRRVVIFTLITASLWAVPAQAERSSSWDEVGQQWANLNSCDSGSHTVGVRASQAGDSAGRRLFSRFSYQWFSHEKHAWLPVAGGGSGWLDAGSGPWLSHETGWNQTFAPAPAGASFRIRGVVELQWRKGGSAAKSTTLVTQTACDLR